MSETEEITIEETKVLRVRLAQSEHRGAVMQAQLAARVAQEAETAMKTVEAAFLTDVTEGGKYELVGEIDIATGKGKRKLAGKAPLHAVESNGRASS